MFIEHERLTALRQGAANSKPEGLVSIRTVDLRWLVGLVDHFLAAEQRAQAAETKAAEAPAPAAVHLATIHEADEA
jgi:hypothetical protein